MLFNFDSSMPNALQLSAVAGSLRTILKTYLVDGAGAGAVATLTVTGGVATATYSGGHPFRALAVGQFAGSSIAALNGLKRILTASANAVTYAAPGVPDGAATGSITSKLAPAGWSELFSGSSANVLALKSAALDATGCVLRLDDSGTTVARVNGYSSMSDIATGLDVFPTAAQLSGGQYWPKAHNVTGNREWAIVADERAFYFYVRPTSGTITGSLLGFGDLVAQRAGDPWAAFIDGHASALYTGGAGCLSAVSAAAANTLALPRASNGLGTGVMGNVMSALRTSGVSGHATGSQFATYPNPADAGLLLMPAWCFADGLRGRLPGLYHSPQSVVGMDLMNLQAVPGYLPVQTNVGGVAGVAFIKTEGDWR